MKRYKINQRYAGKPTGTFVYDTVGHDYGLASADSRMTGVEHVTVTLKADGKPPGFTIPKHMLEEF